ncbi:hypothetical protein CAOG_007306 [Capsaspora owczarzaki ATCC 30864]|uniref:Actin-related protein 5 n=1 Tax=Capsaspora owczarzaki (strain ATCC 30864) TaxID=595528 RepID=A0A0D2WXG1_CAPO3|nr:hypothetical protein CAOG_007306 [Capsaspora owczarzaki ATCC 30864]
MSSLSSSSLSQAIVIDNGSFMCRAGWSGNADPSLAVKNIIARLRTKTEQDEQKDYLGDQVKDWDTLSKWRFRQQLDRDVVTNFTVAEDMLDFVFRSLLDQDQASSSSHQASSSGDGQAPVAHAARRRARDVRWRGSSHGEYCVGRIDHPIVMTETMCNPNSQRAFMNELLFECYNVPAVSYGVDSLFSLHYNAKPATSRQASVLTAPLSPPLSPHAQHLLPIASSSTALVLAAGNYHTHVIPYINGRVDSTNAKRIAQGGHQCISYLNSLLSLKYPQHKAAFTGTRCTEWFWQHCRVAHDYDEELRSWHQREFDADAWTSAAVVIQLPFTAPTVRAPEISEEEQQQRKAAQAERFRKMLDKRQEVYEAAIVAEAEQRLRLEESEQQRRQRWDSSTNTNRQAQRNAALAASRPGLLPDRAALPSAPVGTELVGNGESDAQPAHVAAASAPVESDQPDGSNSAISDTPAAPAAAAETETSTADNTSGSSEIDLTSSTQPQSEASVTSAPLVDISEEQLTPAQLREQRKLQIVAIIKEERLVARKARQGKFKREVQEMKLNPVESAAALRESRNELLRARERRLKQKEQLSDKRSAASRQRMRLIVQQMHQSGTSLKVSADDMAMAGSGDVDSSDTFGLNDDDWQVYHEMQRKDAGGSDSENERIQLERYERQLRIIDPTFVAEEKRLAAPESLAEMHQVELAAEQHRIPEILFQPSLLGSDQAGLIETIAFVLKHYNAATQQQLARNVFLTGGTSSLPGIGQRILQNMVSIRPFRSVIEIRHATDPLLDAWRGASLWGNEQVGSATQLSHLSPAFITRQEYEEKGSEYLKEHSFSNLYFPTPAVLSTAMDEGGEEDD